MPAKADEVYAQWRAHMAELATCPNVVAKLGGINMEVNGFGWHTKPRPPTSQELVDATRHYYEYTLEHFGVERCMFESNFPVDKESCSYTVLWNAFKRLTAGYSADEKAKLFHDTPRASTAWRPRGRRREGIAGRPLCLTICLQDVAIPVDVRESACSRRE